MSGTKFSCPHCEQHVEVPDSLLGRTIECPTCQGIMTLPRPLAEAALAEPSKVVNRPAIPRKRLVLRRGDMRAPGRGGQAADDVKGMQFCAHCGEELLPRARKCTFCGRAVAAVHEDAPARPRAPTTAP